MVVLIAFVSICMTLYLHYLQRCCLIACLRTNHSLSFIKKLKKGAKKWEWFTGFYLLKGGRLKEAWLKPVLCLLNASLLSVPVILFCGLLVLLSVIPASALMPVYMAMVYKDLLLLLILIILVFVKK